MKSKEQKGEQPARMEKLKAHLERSHLDYTVKQNEGSTVVEVRRKEKDLEKGKGKRD